MKLPQGLINGVLCLTVGLKRERRARGPQVMGESSLGFLGENSKEWVLRLFHR